MSISINDDYLENNDKFESVGIKIPKYNQSELIKKTTSDPIWVHFGGGNLFRCFHSSMQQELLNSGDADKGIIVGESYDEEVISKVYNQYSNRAVKVILDNEGNFDTELIASVTEGVFLNKENPAGIQRMKEIFENKSLQLITFTITEKGYVLHSSDGKLFPAVKEEIENFNSPLTLIGHITKLLYYRFESGGFPISLLSTDNFFNNGEQLKKSVLFIANEWKDRGFVKQEFIDYLSNSEQVAFPCSMIDKITPAPAKVVADTLKEKGFIDTEIVKTEKGTLCASFVNAEKPRYLVVEDKFPNGRPAFEKLEGIYMTTRDIVGKSERMKVCTCLNPIHTGIGAFGCLLGIDTIANCMKDNDIKKLAKIIGYKEGLPVVTDPGIINPKKFIDEVINERLTNPYVPDTPERMTVDESQMLSIRFGVTISEYVKNSKLDPTNLVAIPLAIASWFRYSTGYNDNGEKMELSPDPAGVSITKLFNWKRIGEKIDTKPIYELLKDKAIFGVDLVSVKLADKIVKFFLEMNSKQGSVRKVLSREVSQLEQK
jgi:fructuronate reductase